MISGTPGTLNSLLAATKWSMNDFKHWGDPGSFPAYGAGWAQVSMTPFSQYKGMTAEGGIRNALIVSGPAVKRPKGSINGGVMHVADIMPTLLELAGATYPKTHNGRDLPPLIGTSWVRMLAGDAESPRTDQDYLAWEIFGNRAVRQGDWKLRWEWKPFGKGEWELFNVVTDPGERKDVAAANPERATALLARWDEYVKANNVILPSRSYLESAEDTMPPRFPDDYGYPPLLFKRQFVPPAALIKK
jgi:arylsulfatase